MYQWTLKNLNNQKEYILTEFTNIKNIQFEAGHPSIVRIWLSTNRRVLLNQVPIRIMKYAMHGDIITIEREEYLLTCEYSSDSDSQEESGIETDTNTDCE